jgi:hypothetical protein
MNGTDLREQPLVERKNSFMNWCGRVGANGYYTPNISTAQASSFSSTFAPATSRESWQSAGLACTKMTATLG